MPVHEADKTTCTKLSLVHVFKYYQSKIRATNSVVHERELYSVQTRV